MKKVIAVVCTFVLALALVACGAQQPSGSTSSSGEASAPAPSVPVSSADTETTSDGETTALVVYYSATGSTAAVAETIAAEADAELFELVPVEPYTSEDLNWSNDDSRVTVEHENEDQRDVELVNSTVDNWDDYDVVFVGYPIWWGIAAWPVNQFVETNDFTGKTVIPFCTSASSGIGESGQLLADMAGTGDWQEGMRFRSGASEADVAAWLNDLGL